MFCMLVWHEEWLPVNIGIYVDHTDPCLLSQDRTVKLETQGEVQLFVSLGDPDKVVGLCWLSSKKTPCLT